ncbi:monoheme cytochrome C [Maribacter algicola]|uniref:Monoheme cytochrome C n=1 Tax=Meishania litoralis TaxID=3434685 RepID=A0ACC7LKG0_9FLAO
MENKGFWKGSRRVYRTLIVVCAVLVIFSIIAIYLMNGEQLNVQDSNAEYSTLPDNGDPNRIVDGIHVRTGLVEGEGLMTVVNNCTNCHSAELVMQNRMNKERWISTIRWMQKTQNLWDLGDNEEIIVNYLVTNYPPVEKGRREALSDIDWYQLKD